MSHCVLDLGSALSLYFMCQKYSIPCILEVVKPLDIEKIPKEIVEVAKIRSKRKLPRKYYKFKELRL